MKRYQKRYIEQRCRERGYELADVMPCVAQQDGDWWTVDVDHPAYPRSKDKPKAKLKLCSKVSKRSVSWSKQLDKWQKLGCPSRTDAEQTKIIEICQACPNYKPKNNKHTCKLCNCGCKKQLNTLEDRIRMTTEACPKNPPEW